MYAGGITGDYQAQIAHGGGGFVAPYSGVSQAIGFLNACSVSWFFPVLQPLNNRLLMNQQVFVLCTLLQKG